MEVDRVQSTAASNRIEGISTTGARMRELMSQRTVPRNRDEQKISGYRDALSVIHENHDFMPVTPNVLLQLHRDLYSRQPQGEGGPPRMSETNRREVR